MEYIELHNLKNNEPEKPVTKSEVREILKEDLAVFSEKFEKFRVAMREDVTKIVESAVGDLAIIVGKGFADVYQRFDRIDERFEEIDRRFDRIDERFVIIDKRFDSVDVSLKGLDNRIIGVNNRMDYFATNFTRFDEHLKLEKRVDKLELKSA